jgi:hypothetical protein
LLGTPLRVAADALARRLAPPGTSLLRCHLASLLSASRSRGTDHHHAWLRG